MSANHQGWTLVQLCRRQAACHRDREFLSFEQGGRLSFSSLDTESDRLALALSGQGVVPGDRVLALLKNRAEFMVAMLAVHKLGAVFVTINTEFRGAFLEHQLRNSAPRLILCEAALCGSCAGIDESDGTQSVTVIVAGERPPELPPVLAGGTVVTWDQLPSKY